ncbi:hypothetical protein DH09_04225 [Bacillaceae bacterium JMAK1]|nr:hypothetical protein DH09_04225 [Bacillaceae bacterium JMAK1]
MSQFAHKHQHVEEHHQSQNVRAVKKRIQKRITLGEKCIMFMILAIVVTTALFMISNYANIYGQNSSIDTLERDIAAQQERNAGLDLQVAELSDPERILHLAQEHGMELNEANVQVVTGNE